jgi:integrase/recombinase XerD
MSTPATVITIFVRHSSGCKYAGDEFAKRCNCRKHFRWSANGQQHRQTAGTRSWTEAEELKRDLENQLAGRLQPVDPSRYIQSCIDTFLTDKRVQGVSEGVLKKYALELDRLARYCERHGVFTIQGVERELLTGFAATWKSHYPSSYTRSKVRERCRSFLRYCFEAQWIPRVPSMPKIKVDEPPTLPLTDAEFTRLLAAVHATEPRRWDGKQTRPLTPQTAARIHALLQLMRWSGLAIRDAVTLERDAIQFDDRRKLYRVRATRQKTGTDVSVVIPTAIAEELQAVTNDNPRYFFWTGDCTGETIAKTWANRYIRPVFEASGISCDGHMLSHRLRDTFAVDLLSRGVPVEEVSRALGHESIRTTERHYAKWVQSRQDRLDDLISGAWSTGSTVPKRREKGDAKPLGRGG